MSEVFISYKWGGESEAIANAIEQTFQKKNIKLVRDKTDLGYKGLIKEFMQQIGQGKCIVVIISDEYLKSRNCMYELLEILENGDFYDRIFPIVLSNARIYKAVEGLDYINYWEDKIKELNDQMKRVSSLANLQRFTKELDLYTKIRHRIEGLLDILGNMNTLTPQMHKDTDFGEVIKAIENRLNELSKLPRSSNIQSTMSNNYAPNVQDSNIINGHNNYSIVDFPQLSLPTWRLPEFSLPSVPINRRKWLKWMGLGGVGGVVVFLGKSVPHWVKLPSEPIQPIIPSKPIQTGSPVLVVIRKVYDL